MAKDPMKYLIQLAIDDEHLNRQLKGIKWDELTGGRGKDIVALLDDASDEGRRKIIENLSGLNIDWAKVLGMDALEKALGRSLKTLREELDSQIKLKVDASQIEKTVATIEGLGNAFKELGSEFDAKSIARGIVPLMNAMKGLPDSVSRVEKAFDKLFEKINQNKDTGETIISPQKLQAESKQVLKFANEIDKLNTLLSDLSKKKIKINADEALGRFEELKAEALQLESVIDELTDGLDSPQSKDKNYLVNLKAQIAESKLELANLYRQMQSADDTYLKANKGKKSLIFLSGIDTDEGIADAKKYANQVIGELSKIKNATDNVKNVSEIGVSVTIPTESDIRKQINDVIDKLNKPGALHKIKLEVDEALDASAKDVVGTKVSNYDAKVIEAEIQKNDAKIAELRKKQAEIKLERDNAQTTGPQNVRQGAINAIEKEIESLERLQTELKNTSDSSMQHSVSSVIQGLNSIDSVIDSKTQNWRNKIVKALNVNKDEISIPFTIESTANAVFTQLQNFFDENEIAIRLDKDIIAQQLKQAVEEGGLPIGGSNGTVAFDEKSLAMAVATGIQAFFTGDFTSVVGEKKKVADPTAPKKDKPLFLDPNNAYNKEMAEMFRSIVDYAQKRGAPSKKVAGFLDGKLVGTEFWDETTKSANLEKLAKASSADLIEVLGHMTDKYGKTLSADFGDLIGKTKNKLLSNFQADLNVLLETQNIKQTTVNEDEKSRKRQEMWDDYLNRGSLKTGLLKLKVKPENLKIPELDALTNMQKSAKQLYGEDNEVYKAFSSQIEILKAAREDLKNVNDEGQKAEFLKAVERFNSSTDSIFKELERYLNEFEWGIELKGFKNLWTVTQGRVEGLLKAIDGDLSKIVTPHLYRAPESVSAYTENRPDRTDILNKEIQVREFKTREGIAKEISEAEALLVEAKNNKDEAQILAQQVRIASLKERQKQLPNVTKRWEEKDIAKTETTKLENQLKARAQEAALTATEFSSGGKELIDERVRLKTRISEAEEEIEANNKRIDELNDDGRKIAGARTRLNNRQESLRQSAQDLADAKKANELAQEEKKNAEEYRDEILKGNYKDIDEANRMVTKYSEWNESPLKHREDLIGKLKVGKDGATRLDGGVYQDIYNNARYYRDLAAENIKTTEQELVKENNRLNKLLHDEKVFGKSEQLDKAILDATRKRDRLQRELVAYQNEQEQNQKVIDEVLRKRQGATRKDKTDFTKDAKAYTTEKLNYWKSKRAQYDDPRIEANQRIAEAEEKARASESLLQEAQTVYDKALQEYEVVKQDATVQKSIDIDVNKRKNQVLAERIKEDKSALDHVQKNIDQEVIWKNADTEGLLGITGTKDDIDNLVTDIENLEQRVRASRNEVEAIDEFVKETLKGENYKKPTYNIKRNNKDEKIVSVKDDIELRKTYLDEIIENRFKEGYHVPNNVTSNMQSVIETLTTDRLMTEVFSELSKFDAPDKDGKKKTDTELKQWYDKLVNKYSKNSTAKHTLQRFYGMLSANVDNNTIKTWMANSMSSYSEDATKQLETLKGFAATDDKSIKDMQSSIENADSRLKEAYKKQIKSWFSTISKKIKIVKAGEKDDASLEAKKEAGLALKEIEGIFPLITKALGEYKKQFGERFLLKENAALYRDRNKYSYGSFTGGALRSDESELQTKTNAIINSERYALLQMRQAELLSSITNTSKDGGNTSKLEKDLAAINNELAKYEQFVRINENKNLMTAFADDSAFVSTYKESVIDMIQKEQSLVLSRAKGASDSELDAQYKEMNDIYAKRDEFLYNELIKRQTNLLTQIEKDTKDGKSTEQSVKSLQLVNAELVNLEATRRRIAQLGVGGSLYKDSEGAVSRYTEAIKEQIKLEQELSILIAKKSESYKEQIETKKKLDELQRKGSGNEKEKTELKQRLTALKERNSDINQKADELRQAQVQIDKDTEQARKDRMNRDAAASPYVYAMRELIELEKQYQLALQQRYAIKGRRKSAENQLDDVKNDEYYSTSWQYKRHLDAVKSEETTNYRYSDQYREDRAKGMEKALQETFEEVKKSVRIAVENEYKSSGKAIDDTTIQDEINKIVEQRSGEAMYRLTQTLGKRGMKIDPSKLPEETGFYLATGGWEGLRGTIEESFEGSDEYKALIEKRTQARKLALEKEIAAINKESNEIIASIASASEETDTEMWAKVSRRMTHLDKINPGVFTSEETLETAARNSLIGEQEARARARVEKMKGRFEADKFYADKDTEKEIREAIDKALQRYINTALQGIDKSDFDQMGIKESGALQDIMETLHNSMEKYVYNLVSDYRAKLETQGGVITTVDGRERNVRQEVIAGLSRQIYGGEVDVDGEKFYHRGYDQRAQDIENLIANIERQRRAAMEYGGIKSSEITDAEVLRDQAILQEKLTEEKERQKELTDEITRLEKEGASSDKLGKLGSQLEKTSDNVRRLQMFVDNKDVLMDLMHKAKQDEKAASAMTLDEQKLMYEAKKTAAEAQLENADERSRKHIEERLARYVGILEDLDTKIADRDAKEREKNDPMNIIANKFAGAIKQALGGNGGLNVDATGLASEATLSQIYEILTGIVQAMGGKVIRDPEKDAMIKELRALEAEKAAFVGGNKANGGTTVTSISNKTNKSKYNPADEPQYIQDARNYYTGIKNKSSDELVGIINNLIAVAKDTSKTDEERFKAQLELQKTINAFGNQNKNNDAVPFSTYKRGDKKGQQYHSSDDYLKYLTSQYGISQEDLGLKLSEAKAREIATQKTTVQPNIAPAAIAEEVKENVAETPAIATVKPEVAKEASSDYATKLKEILGSINGETKGTEKSLDAVSGAMDRLKKTKGVEAFKEFKESLLALKSSKGTIEDVTQKAQTFVDTFANYKNNSFSDLDKWFGKDVQADATSLLGVVKQIFELTSKEHAIRKANKPKTEVVAAQQKADAAEREAVATEKTTEEKAEQKAIESTFPKEKEDRIKELKRGLAGYTGPQVDFSEVDIGLAKEETLKSIYALLEKIKTEGIKKGASGTGKKKTTKADEAELIARRALVNKEAIASMSGNSRALGKYGELENALKGAVERVQKDVRGHKSNADIDISMAEVKKLAQQISALGFNILKDASGIDYRIASADKLEAPEDFKFDTRENLRASMEKLAQNNADGKQYKFLDFDGTKLTYQLTNINGEIEKVTMEWSEFSNLVGITTDKNVSKLDTLANKVQSFGEKFKNAIDAGYLANNDADLERFKKKVEEINTAITNGASFDNIDALRNEALRIADEVNKKVNKVKKSYSGTNEMNAATRQHDNMEARGVLENDGLDKVKDYNKAYDDLIAKHREFSTVGTLYDPENQKILQNMAIRVKALGKELETAQTRSEDLQQKVANSGLYNGKAIGDISQVAQGTDMYEQMRAKLEELGATNIKIDMIHQKATGTIRHNNRVVSDLEVAYDELTGSLARYHRQERESLIGIPAFLNGFQKKFNSIMQYLSMTMSIHRVIAEVRKGVQYVREIDKALTELKKVTDETEETYDKFLKTAAKTGERLGSTISAVTEATATFAKLGYSMKQASEMAEAAIVYKNVGDNIASTEDAADSIISTLKGFGLEASESMAIVDKFNEVGNNFAITSQGIGEALRLSASALNEGGNSLDEAIGMITAANEVVNDPSSVGTALKTLTLRLRGSKTELEEMGEDVSNMATTTSQLQAKLLALTGGKVDIMLDENTFKNSTQILREMAEAWEDMDDISRASALELMGGKRQANVLSALIQNFDTVEEVIEASANSAGSALKENERYLDSIQGKIDQFTNATQTMWSNFLDADWVKRIVEIGTWLIKLIDGVEILGVKIGGLLPTLIALSAVVIKIKYQLSWSALFAGIGKGVTKLNTNLTKLASRFGILNTTATATSASMSGVTVEMFKQRMATAGVGDETQRLILSKMGLTNAEATQLIGSKALTLSTLQEAMANKTLSTAQALSIAQKLGLITVTKGLNVANASNIMQLIGLDRQQRLSIISTLGLTMQTKKLTKEEIMNAIAKAGVTDAAKKEHMANLMLLASQGKLSASFKLLGMRISDFISKNMALLAIAGAIAIIYGIIKAADALIDTSEELKEKLSESQNALDATTSELKDLRNELDEVSKAIQELQTQGTLSLTDQEELNRLRTQRRELESTIALKSQLETAQQKKVNGDAQDLYDSYKTTNFKNGKDRGEYMEIGATAGSIVGGVAAGALAGVSAGMAVAAALTAAGSVVPVVGNLIGLGVGLLITAAGAAIGAAVGAAGGAGISELGQDVEEQLDAIKTERDELEKKRDEAYRAYVANPEDEKLLKKYEKAEEKLTEYDSKMAEHVAEIQQMRNQMDWSTATPSQRKTIEEMDDFIDRYNIIMQSQGAVGNAIERIFGYDRYDGISERIEELVEKYKETEDETILTQISAEAKKAQSDLADVGLSIQDVVDYYTLEKGLFDTSTIEGVTNQYLKGIKLMQELADNTKPIEIKIDNEIQTFSFDDLFEQDESGKFKAREKEFSEMLKGMDEKAQNTFKKFAEHVKNGELTWSQAMEAMKHSANLAGYEFIGQQIADANAEIFKGIKDDINGTIDTFGEFKFALEDVATSMDLLHKAQEQMNTANRLSVQTALEIIESTDDWNDVLDITNGTITLQEGATDKLIQSKLDLVKANIENEIQQLEEQKSTILAQDASNDFAMTIEESTNLAIRNMAGSMAYLTTMMEAYTRAANGEKIKTEDYIAKAEQAKLEAIDGAKGELDWKKNSAEATGLETINKRLEDAYARLGLINQVDTVDEFKDNYDFDETPGDKYDEDEDSKLAERMAEFQREMDYWENRIAANQAKYEQLQNEIDLLEAKGQKADASFYEEQIELEKEREWLLGEQKKAAQAHLATLEEGSEEWWEVANTLNDIEGELDDVTASILDLQDAIGEIDTYKFEEFNTRLDNLTSKLETIRNLIAPDGEEDWFSEDGSWTESGVAVLGSYLQELETYKQGYAETVEELNKYAASYEGNEAYYETLGIHSEQEYYDKTEELISQQYNFAESISDTEQSVIDMYESSIDAVEEYVDTLIDGYNDYIDSVKEALDAERDLYDFKKNVQKQAKDIAELERRIASLSGSTNASDIAERRKLEAQLYESRESLNDTYYDHAKESQQNALDAEQTAYEESMTRFVEGLRTSLEEATINMDEFLMGVTSMVMYNADTVLTKYQETNLPLTEELTNPWEEAKKATSSYSGNALELMNQWTKEGGFFAQFNASGTTSLKSPWSAGTTAANSFKTSVSTVMSGVVSNIATNVKTASSELSKLYQQIQDTEKRAASANVSVGSTGTSSNSSSYVAPQKKYYVTAFLDMGSRSLSVTKSDTNASAAMSAAKIAIAGEYEKVKGNSISAETAWQRTWRDKVKYTTQYYAKGTTGVPNNELAIVDELGPELILHADPTTGRLQYLTKGSSVMTADATAELMKLADIGVNDLMMPKFDSGINILTNYITKPEFNFSVENLLRCDNVSQDTMPELKQFVKEQMDSLVKQMNYSIKRFAR